MLGPTPSEGPPVLAGPCRMLVYRVCIPDRGSNVHQQAQSRRPLGPALGPNASSAAGSVPTAPLWLRARNTSGALQSGRR